MENASKALIIAGAILISILLISIGIILVNSGSEITDTATSGMQSQEIQAFNAQFTSYEGKKNGTELKQLFSVVNANNAVNAGHQVKFKTGTGQITKAADLVPSKTYTVVLTLTSGYVTEISVK